MKAHRNVEDLEQQLRRDAEASPCARSFVGLELADDRLQHGDRDVLEPWCSQ